MVRMKVWESPVPDLRCLIKPGLLQQARIFKTVSFSPNHAFRLFLPIQFVSVKNFRIFPCRNIGEAPFPLA